MSQYQSNRFANADQKVGTSCRDTRATALLMLTKRWAPADTRENSFKEKRSESDTINATYENSEKALHR